MNAKEQEAVQRYKREIVDCIETNIQRALNEFADDIGGHPEMDILSLQTIQVIQYKGIPRSQTIELVRVLQQNDRGFKALTTALELYGRKDLADKLKQESGTNLMLNNGATAGASTNSYMSPRASTAANAVEARKGAINTYRSDLHSCLLPIMNQALAYFRVKGCITLATQLEIQNQSPVMMPLALIDILSNVDSGWITLNSFLSEHGYTDLSSKLQAAAGSAR